MFSSLQALTDCRDNFLIYNYNDGDEDDRIVYKRFVSKIEISKDGRPYYETTNKRSLSAS